MQYIAFFQSTFSGAETWQLLNQAQLDRNIETLGEWGRQFLYARQVVAEVGHYDAETDAVFPIYTLADGRSYGWPDSSLDGQQVVSIRLV